MSAYRPELKDLQVHVWEADLDSTAVDDVGVDSLSADERRRAELIRAPSGRRRFISCRTALRKILGSYLGVDPGALNFAYGPWGKPVLAPPHGDLHFNVSHSEGHALIAVTRTGNVGIDLERVRSVPEWESIAESVFTSADLDSIQEAPPDRRPRVFMDSWTKREAILKQVGCGWSGNSIICADKPLPAVQPLTAADDHVAALAATRSQCEIVRLKFH